MTLKQPPLRRVVARTSVHDPPWYYEPVTEELECGHTHETWGSRRPAKRRRCWYCDPGFQDEQKDMQRITMEWDAYRNEQ